jgi:hypothetical protein
VNKMSLMTMIPTRTFKFPMIWNGNDQYLGMIAA